MRFSVLLINSHSSRTINSRFQADSSGDDDDGGDGVDTDGGVDDVDVAIEVVFCSGSRNNVITLLLSYLFVINKIIFCW